MARDPVKPEAAGPPRAAQPDSAGADGIRKSQDAPADQIREMEARYRIIFEAAGEAMVIATPDGLVAEANPAYCRMLGYAHDELIGLHASATVHPDYRHVIAEGLERVNRDVPFRREIVLLRKDGTSFPADAGATTFMYRGTPHELVVLRDVTERVEAEKQIREREAEYRGIFEATNDGLMISDLDGRIVEANPAYCRMYGYTREELIGLHSTALAAPESQHTIAESVETLAADAYHTVAQALHKDGSTFFAEARAARFTYRGRPHYLSVVQDVTERVRAYELLEERVEERTRELSTLLKVSKNVSSTLELQPLLELILDQLKVVADYVGAALLVVQGGDLAVLVRRAPGPDPTAGPDRYPLEANPLWDLLQQNQPIIVDDVRGDTALARAYRASVGEHLQTAFAYERSWLGAPMSVKDRVVGVIALSSDHVGYFTPHHADLALAIAQQAAIAIENARLYERSEQRSRELATLLDISHNVTSTLEVRPLLDLILEQLKTVAEYDGAGIVQLAGDELRVIGYRGPIPQAIALQTTFPANSLPVWEHLTRGEPVIIQDVRGDDMLARAYQRAAGERLDTLYAYVRCFLAVPMTLKGQVIGAVTLEHSLPGYYSRQHLALALAIAQQAAIAIENARLYERAQEAAALEERQRLSRELHDSVSQALYSIALGARTARALVDADPPGAAAPLDFVLAQAARGMAEMRALIFALRPEALEQEGLVAALARQAEAVQARHDLPVEAALGAEPDLPLPAKEALYRIAQEALHNAVKHARARHIRLALSRAEGEIALEVRDDGTGFDPAGSFPGHLGLSSMRERVVPLRGRWRSRAQRVRAR